MVRVALASATLILLISFGTSYVEFVVQGTQVGSFAPAGNAILPFLILALVLNPVLRRWTSRQALTTGELVAVYALLLAVASLASCQFAQWVVLVCTGPFYYANPSNRWEENLGLIPSWWAPGDREDIRRFYEGLRAGETVRWMVWWKPLLAWGPFVLILYLTVLCVLSLLRRAWIEDERLAFPLTQLPLEVARSRESLFRTRLLWLGAMLPLTIHGLNGLHHLFPTFPSLPLRDALKIGQYLTTLPWTGAQPIWLDIYFCLIGFAFLSGRDVPFSMWFFYLLFKLESVIGAAFGWNPGWEDRSLTGNTFPLIEAQHVGSMLALVAIVLWSARIRLRAAWLAAWGRMRDESQAAEAIAYRKAFLGLALGFAALTGWCVLSGMPVWAAAVAMSVSLAFIIGVHRMMAEGGINFLWAAQSGTNYLFHSFGGAQFLPAKSWLVLLTLPYFVWNFKGPVGPQALEAFKMAHETGVQPRRLAPLMLVGMALTMLLSYWSVIYLVHSHGGGVALDGYRFVHVGQRPFMELQEVTTSRAELSLPKVTAMVLSAAATWVIGWMRWLHPWWRLHPLGYAASTIWAMNFMWFSLLLGSTASWLITRLGGLKLYSRARPFFLGLVLGDFAALGLWTAIMAMAGVRDFRIFGH